MDSVVGFAQRQREILLPAISQSLEKAGRALSAMVQSPVRVAVPDVAMVGIDEITPSVGGAGVPVVAAYLGITGDMAGHLMFMFPMPVGFDLVDRLLGQPPKTTITLGTLETSALAELANITGSSILNGLADAAGLRVLPSSPKVRADMAGALLESVLVPVAQHAEQVVLIRTVFEGEGWGIVGDCFILPTVEGLQTLVQGLVNKKS